MWASAVTRSTGEKMAWPREERRHRECTELLSEGGPMIFYISTSSLSGCRVGSVTGILVLEIFAGKYGPPLEKSVRVEDPHFRPSFSNKRI